MTAPNASARARLEELMVDRCLVARPPAVSQRPVYDRGTGDQTPPLPTEVYDGPCMVTAQRAVAGEGDRGGAQETIARYQVSVPLDAGPFAIGDIVTITETLGDPDLVDQVLVVTTVHLGSQVARRRLTCELQTASRKR